MYVWVCNAITDREIRACAELGAATLDELREHLGVASCCGRCRDAAHAVLTDCVAGRAESHAA